MDIPRRVPLAPLDVPPLTVRDEFERFLNHVRVPVPVYRGSTAVLRYLENLSELLVGTFKLLHYPLCPCLSIFRPSTTLMKAILKNQICCTLPHTFVAISVDTATWTLFAPSSTSTHVSGHILAFVRINVSFPMLLITHWVAKYVQSQVVPLLPCLQHHVVLIACCQPLSRTLRYVSFAIVTVALLIRHMFQEAISPLLLNPSPVAVTQMLLAHPHDTVSVHHTVPFHLPASTTPAQSTAPAAISISVCRRPNPVPPSGHQSLTVRPLDPSALFRQALSLLLKQSRTEQIAMIVGKVLASATPPGKQAVAPQEPAPALLQHVCHCLSYFSRRVFDMVFCIL